MTKRYYPLERQIEDCMKFLGKQVPDVDSMTEDKMLEVENKLKDEFVWVEYEDYAQCVPKHRQSGTLILGG